MPDMKSGTCQT
ncbi:Putative uncharacterized protein [Escherichia coli D6-117.29]|nr:Putative uncharacterized protein [Escherichia coli D6-117.29]